MSPSLRFRLCRQTPPGFGVDRLCQPSDVLPSTTLEASSYVQY